MKPENYSNQIPRGRSHRRGFTLIETLIAIAVLMIAVAGPLSIANHSLTAALYAKDQSIASYLAQEEMEFVKNLKDNILKKPLANGGGWEAFTTLVYMDGGSVRICSFTTPCATDTATMFAKEDPAHCDPDTTCQLYLDPDSGYRIGSASGAVPTLFSRYFFIDQIGDDPNDYQVTVVVKWNEGLVPNIVQLHSELTNSTR